MIYEYEKFWRMDANNEINIIERLVKENLFIVVDVQNYFHWLINIC